MWFKVDDKLHDHRKVRLAGKAAMGVWVLAGSWAMDSKSDGFIPARVLARWGTRSDAKRLVDAGFWREDHHEGEDGWRFHDWAKFQPSTAVMRAQKAAEAEAGVRGNHRRWHVARKITDPDCEYCHRAPDWVPDIQPESGATSGKRRPVPVPESLLLSNDSSENRPPHPDAEALCNRLADRIALNGSKRPTVTEAWRKSARLLLDRDKRPLDEALALVDWCQADSFWRSNVLSMPKFREKYDQLRLKSQQTAPVSRVQGHMALAAQLAAGSVTAIGGQS